MRETHEGVAGRRPRATRRTRVELSVFDSSPRLRSAVVWLTWPCPAVGRNSPLLAPPPGAWSHVALPALLVCDTLGGGSGQASESPGERALRAY